MKQYLTTLTTILITFLTPIVPLILMVGLTIFLDTIFGVWRSYRLGLPITSKKMSQLVGKMVLYQSAVVLFFCIDKYILYDITSIFTNIELFLTKLVSLTLITIEFQSINENYKQISGINIWDKFKTILKRGNEIKSEINNIVNKSND